MERLPKTLVVLLVVEEAPKVVVQGMPSAWEAAEAGAGTLVVAEEKGARVS